MLETASNHKTAPLLTLAPEEWLESHLFLDEVALALHRAVAERLRQDPPGVIAIARANLQRWLKPYEGETSPCAWLEWRAILDRETPEEICALITQDSDEGQRLRSSTPFAGVITQAERRQIWQTCEKQRTLYFDSAR